ncbi:MAG: restriction endonuclease [Chloroflexota bacterium]|nr:restriction endonuclease [Chloroflexota bacterium]
MVRERLLFKTFKDLRLRASNAQSHVDLILNLESLDRHKDLLGAPSTGVERRLLLTGLANVYGMATHLRKALRIGWKAGIGAIHFNSTETLIIDRQDVWQWGTGESRALPVTGNPHSAVRSFDAMWNYWRSVKRIEPVTQELKPSAQLLKVSSHQWDQIVASLSKNPGLLHVMSPRRFEELVAELLEREGLRVKLTPPQRDGGFDILAFLNTPLGEHLYLVECKRWAPHRRVDVTIVRQLLGVLHRDEATAAMLVTTSSFTVDARREADIFRYRLSLKGYDDLVRWLRLQPTGHTK